MKKMLIMAAAALAVIVVLDARRAKRVVLTDADLSPEEKEEILKALAPVIDLCESKLK